MLYISSSSRVVLPRLGLEFLPVKISSVSFCPFQSFPSIACVRGERVLVLSEVYVVLDGDIFCGGLNIDGMSSILSSASVFDFPVFFLVPLVPMVPSTGLNL